MVRIHPPLLLRGDEVLILVNRYKCGYCGTCVGVCPSNALDLIELWLEIDQDSCSDCRSCVDVCPVGALAMEVE
ncbi:MAG: ferredoxin [Candidatus Syntrophoarchaeum caldarius]|uniref:Ferredoxin n=1 Tax=Candidatus Syntropharchaeum caldarium TaxID=1838285 RepID=A0A1F2PA88_9EURY|nr:MAG: ferredoxin [Candidatus Syntrophoarchaeum caldarius]